MKPAKCDWGQVLARRRGAVKVLVGPLADDLGGTCSHLTLRRDHQRKLHMPSGHEPTGTGSLPSQQRDAQAASPPTGQCTSQPRGVTDSNAHLSRNDLEPG